MGCCQSSEKESLGDLLKVHVEAGDLTKVEEIIKKEEKKFSQEMSDGRKQTMTKTSYRTKALATDLPKLDFAPVNTKKIQMI